MQIVKQTSYEILLYHQFHHLWNFQCHDHRDMSLKRCNSISTVFTLPMHAVSTPQMVNITNTSAFLTADSLFNFQGFYISAKICFHIIRGLLNQNESCMLCRLVNKGTQWTQWKPLKENNRSTEKNKPHPIWTQT